MGSQVCKRLSSRCCGRCEHRTGWCKGRSEQSPRTSGPRGLREIPEDFWSQGLRAIPGLQDPRGSEQSPRTSGPQALRAIPGLQDPGAQSNPPGLQDPGGSKQSQDFRTSGCWESNDIPSEHKMLPALSLNPATDSQLSTTLRPWRKSTEKQGPLPERSKQTWPRWLCLCLAGPHVSVTRRLPGTRVHRARGYQVVWGLTMWWEHRGGLGPL